MGLRRGQIDGRSRIIGLQFEHVANAHPVPSHPALVEGRTIYPTTVRGPDTNVLKLGLNQRKLGGKVTKGPWKGFPIYSLTLEERKTCPRSCGQWRTCMGNHMGRSVRYDYGLPLELQLWRELHALNRRHRKQGGFVVRAHILGDFYSESYVDLWEAALDWFPRLHVFGYTHWQKSTPIGAKVARLRDRCWDRFAIRTSDAFTGPRTSVVTKRANASPGAIICPVQEGRTRGCASCGLCWHPVTKDRDIAFLAH